MRIELLFFGKFGEIYAEHMGEFEVPIHVETLSDLIDELDRNKGDERYLRMNNVKVLVNQAITHCSEFEERKLKNGDEVGFLPPVSGG